MRSNTVSQNYMASSFETHQRDEAQEAELYGASILMLLKPWRQIQDLKAKTESFEASLNYFLQNASERDKQIINNIHYYHDCWDAAQARRDAYRKGERVPIFDYERQAITNASDDKRGK